jgi:precorrin-6B methylase 2
MSKRWTPNEILAVARGYQGSCVIAAAADLDLFAPLARKPQTAAELAAQLRADARGTTVLLDALVALQLLEKRGKHYVVPDSVAASLTASGSSSVLAMAQHTANCLRRWAQLAHVVRTGRPAERTASVRGEQADQAAFIGAMDNINAPVAAQVIADIEPLDFNHVLDVGGASGTWTIALLVAHPEATATIFDLPHVISMAEQRIDEAELTDRVRLAAGDFYVDRLPRGADLALLSAICHQNSRQQNRDLFAAVREALEPGGRILIRDVVMEESRVSPVAGALFAVNMLTATEGGGTFTFAEFRDDLDAAGFTDVAVLRRDDGMDSIVSARAP